MRIDVRVPAKLRTRDTVMRVRRDHELERVGLIEVKRRAHRDDSRRDEPDDERESDSGHYGVRGVKPTVMERVTLRPAISVRMSPGDARLDLVEAGVTATMA